MTVVGEPAAGESGEEAVATAGPASERRGGFALSAIQAAVVAVAFAFLGGAIGWAVAQPDNDPLSDVDVGFMQDMGHHHRQAVEMSVIALNKESVSDQVKHFSLEIIISQQNERGLFNALLDRYGHDPEPGAQSMGWMGPPVPLDQMMGMASEAQMQQLREAEGPEADALWIALMTEHHLGGLHMADYAARHGGDQTIKNIARNMVRSQRSEVLDMERYRRQAGLPFPDDFGDPMGDQRLNPLSLND